MDRLTNPIVQSSLSRVIHVLTIGLQNADEDAIKRINKLTKSRCDLKGIVSEEEETNNFFISYLLKPTELLAAHLGNKNEIIISLIQSGAEFDERVRLDLITDETTKKALVFNFHQYPRLYEFTPNDFALLNSKNRQRIFTIMLLTKCSILEALPLEILTIIFGLM